ncbi:MAG: hypothetical protein M3Y57_14020 [Acidobacteriota bacterium]|nr:hypothetical protein [Acidobacteriota bacterium]
MFDGRRAWLIDWKAAFLNDRYFDLAIVANFVVTNEADVEERNARSHVPHLLSPSAP